MGNFLLGGGVNGDRFDLLLVGVEILVREGLSRGLEHGLEDLAGDRVGAARGGEAVDDHVDLAEVGLDRLDHLLLHLVGERVSVETLGVEALLERGFLEGSGVVPAAEAVFFSTGSFSKNTPTVDAPPPKAATMREARPYPVEEPTTSTRLGALGREGLLFTYAICSWT